MYRDCKNHVEIMSTISIISRNVIGMVKKFYFVGILLLANLKICNSLIRYFEVCHISEILESALFRV